MVLDMLFMLDSQSDVNAKLLDGLSSRLVYFFGDNPESVLRVWRVK